MYKCPCLFVIYINDLPDCIQFSDTEAYLFAYDSKIFQKLKGKEQCEEFKKYLKSFQTWGEKCLLKFHPENLKCKVMDIGQSRSDNFTYGMVVNNEAKDQKKGSHEKDDGIPLVTKCTFTHDIVMISRHFGRGRCGRPQGYK